MTQIGVVGAGAWGCALALAAERAGSAVVLLSERSPEIWTPGPFPAYASFLERCLTDRPEVLARADLLLLAVPAQRMGASLGRLAAAGAVQAGAPLVICTKGVERGTGRFMHEVAIEALPGRPVMALSGPNFAAEVADDLPAAAVVAGQDEAALRLCVKALSGRNFRLYMSRDVVGVEIGGALKNVAAIACGMAAGKGLGQNAVAALATRALAEFSRLIEAAGGDPSTLYGLSGVGDLLLTCTSPASRNFAYGMRFISGNMPEGGGPETVEGAQTCVSAMLLASRYGAELPVCSAVYRILYEGSPFERESEALLTRPAAFEREPESAFRTPKPEGVSFS